MSSFVPTKKNLREGLLLCFHLQKSAAESRRTLQQAYGVHAPSISTCEYWFKRFRNGDFDTEDKERPGQPRKFEDEVLEALLVQDSSQTQKDLAKSLEVTQSTISERLKKKMRRDNVNQTKTMQKISKDNNVPLIKKLNKKENCKHDDD